MRWAGADNRPHRSGAAGRRRAARRLRHGAEGAGATAGADRRDRARAMPRASIPLLKPGQRLVSRDGDLWRWDGFSVAANAPTGAARRLAGKNRLADIEAELATVRREVEPTAGGGAGARPKSPPPPRPRPPRGTAGASSSTQAARGARSARRGRTRDQPQRGAALGAGRGEDAADREPRRGGRGARRRRAGARGAAAVDRHRDAARRRPERDRRPSYAARRGARGSAGAGARGRDSRAPARRHRRRARSLDHPQRRRGLADRDPGRARRGGQDRACGPRRRPARCSTSSAPR